MIFRYAERVGCRECAEVWGGVAVAEQLLGTCERGLEKVRFANASLSSVFGQLSFVNGEGQIRTNPLWFLHDGLFR